MEALFAGSVCETTLDGPEWFRNSIGARPKRSMIEVEGARVESLSWGDRGRPGLLLLHGFRSHADWWSHLAPMFAEDYRVCALSWSGMGRSEWRNRYDLELYAREAITVAEAEGLFEAAPPSVVGHSLGGHVAAILAATNGERLARAILVDSTVGPRPPVPPVDAERRIYRSVDEAVARFRFTPAQEAEPYIAAWIAGNAVTESRQPGQAAGWVWSFDPQISAKLHRTCAWPLIPQAKCPLDFVRGALSKIVPTALEARQRDHAPSGTRFVTIPQAGHHVLADQPLALVATLRALLA